MQTQLKCCPHLFNLSERWVLSLNSHYQVYCAACKLKTSCTCRQSSNFLIHCSLNTGFFCDSIIIMKWGGVKRMTNWKLVLLMIVTVLILGYVLSTAVFFSYSLPLSRVLLLPDIPLFPHSLHILWTFLILLLAFITTSYIHCKNLHSSLLCSELDGGSSSWRIYLFQLLSIVAFPSLQSLPFFPAPSFVPSKLTLSRRNSMCSVTCAGSTKKTQQNHCSFFVVFSRQEWFRMGWELKPYFSQVETFSPACNFLVY